jgi:hypothetical protein
MIKNIEELIIEVSKVANKLGFVEEIKEHTDNKVVRDYIKKDCKISLDTSNKTKANLQVYGTNDEIKKATEEISYVLIGFTFRIFENNENARFEIDLPKLQGE